MQIKSPLPEDIFAYHQIWSSSFPPILVIVNIAPNFFLLALTTTGSDSIDDFVYLFNVFVFSLEYKLQAILFTDKDNLWHIVYAEKYYISSLAFGRVIESSPHPLG